MPLQLTLRKADAGGSEWKLAGRFDPAEIPCFEVAEGETQTLELGAPFSAETNVQSMASFASIGFSLVGRAGEKYSPGAEKDGTRSPPPKFEVTDESGKAVLSDAFQYG